MIFFSYQTPHRPIYGVISDIPDKPELPLGGNLKQNLISLGANTFANLLEKSEIKDALISKGSFTIFVPTEAAFGKLISRDPREYNNVLLKDKKLLARILLQHIVPRKIGLHDLRHGDRVLTMAGNRIEISEFGGLKIGDAKIIMSLSDRSVGKGIVHFIGSVIYPFVETTDSIQEESTINNFKPIENKPT